MSKVGRNDPCPCGSGRKYKKCCLQKDRKERRERGDESNEEQTPEITPLPEIEEDIEVMPEPDFSPPESPYPQVDMSLPDIPPEKQDIVEEWWDGFMPLFRQEDVDEMIRGIEAFMEKHPDLFVHLELEEGGLFELGVMLGKRGEQSRYAELLMRIRREHPEMYVRAFGYYEIPVITEVLMRGEPERAPEYLNFFREYPDSHPDELKRVVEMLAATNCQEQLFDLARSTAIPCIKSPEVMGGDFVFRWYIFEPWVRFLDRGDLSPEAVEEHVERLRKITRPLDMELNEAAVRRRIVSTFEEPAIDEQMAVKEQQDFEGFCSEMCCNFMFFLHEQRGMSWVTARYLADALESYLLDSADFSSPGSPLNFNQETLDKHLSSSCRSFFGVEGVLAMSVLQAVYEAIPYLKENKLRFTPGADDIRKICQNLHELCLKATPGDDPGRRVFADFPTYRWIG